MTACPDCQTVPYGKCIVCDARRCAAHLFVDDGTLPRCEPCFDRNYRKASPPPEPTTRLGHILRGIAHEGVVAVAQT